ncbi:hypothetical protein [Hymenobacter wooponensis]|uniref:Uncharacterized protein n=1 Tax=Hymenobacter wooponensis TaxID=1525360 RepID=A0A4Z0MKS2_9BACT|nr:hypothetical protein [Hymenobacter wooponensis]TGD79837.1 hypothetical protein EU557_16635 [Hymenobacter wooponensis]
MKQFFASLLLVGATASTALAQSKPAATALVQEPVRYEFCELMRTGAAQLGKPEKEKSGDIFVDFGYGYEKLGGSEQVMREAGKIQVFATSISALNYMGSLGWEIVQIIEQPTSYNTAGTPLNLVYRYMLRRPLTAKGVAAPR